MWLIMCTENPTGIKNKCQLRTVIKLQFKNTIFHVASPSYTSSRPIVLNTFSLECRILYFWDFLLSCTFTFLNCYLWQKGTCLSQFLLFESINEWSTLNSRIVPESNRRFEFGIAIERCDRNFRKTSAYSYSEFIRI